MHVFKKFPPNLERDGTTDAWPWTVLGVRQYNRSCPMTLNFYPSVLQRQNVTSHPLHAVWLPREPLALLTWLGRKKVWCLLPNSWPIHHRWDDVSSVALRESSVCYVATAVRLRRVDSSCLSWVFVHEKRAVVANRVSPAWIGEFAGTNKGC